VQGLGSQPDTEPRTPLPSRSSNDIGYGGAVALAGALEDLAYLETLDLA
jgi:hypothetical protein